MTEVKVPKLAESITEGTVSNWLVSEGDYVNEGDVLLELETDKVNMEIPAEYAGIVKKILKQAGEIVEVGEVIAYLDERSNEEEPSRLEETVDRTSVKQTHSSQASDDTIDKEEFQVKQDPSKETKVSPIASPATRKLAREQGIHVNKIQTGRITMKDVQTHMETKNKEEKHQQSQLSPQKQQMDQTSENPKKPVERKRMSRRQQTIATHLVQAQHNAAMLTTFNEVDMSHIIDIRRRRKDSFHEQHDVHLGFMSFFSKAVVGALKAYPVLNAEVDGQDILYKKYYDIGIAVATDEGLVVPIVRDVDSLSFVEIERHIVSLAQKARSNKLTLEDLRGGTFTITNGGVFGSLLSTPIINAPQVGILGMHTIQKRPVTVDGDKLEHRPMMYIALSYDHRIVDGREAVGFLVKVKKLLEDPELLLLEG